MNVLMLGGAKRVSMAQKFIDAGWRVFSYELTEEEPIALVADTVICGKRWSDPAIYDHLEEVCRSYAIDAVVPFVDGAVEVAARLRDRTGGRIFAPVGNAEDAAAMFDKIEADKRFRNASLPVPPAEKYPMIAKPRFGSASQGLVIVANREERERLDAKKYLFQTYIAEREEITVDCYVSTVHDTVVYISPRRRVAVSGGEVTATVTVRDPLVTILTRQALEMLSLKGAVTVQWLRDLTDGALYIMEINPRPGGGAVCSHYAGCRLPEAVKADIEGRRVEEINPETGVLIKRYPAEAVFYNKQ